MTTPAPPPPSPPASPWLARVAALRRLGVVYAALVALGLALYAGHDGSSTTPRFAVAPGAARRPDLARLDAGATVTASSYDLGKNLHPLFLLDGDSAPPSELRWASAPADRAPWLIVRLPTRADLDHAVLSLAYPLPAALTVACLRGDAVVATPAAPSVATRVTLPLACPDSDGLRIDLTPAARPPEASVSAHEIAVFAAPDGGDAP